MGERKGGVCSFQEKAKNVKIYSIALLQQAKDLYSFFLISFIVNKSVAIYPNEKRIPSDSL